MPKRGRSGKMKKGSLLIILTLAMIQWYVYASVQESHDVAKIETFATDKVIESEENIKSESNDEIVNSETLNIEESVPKTEKEILIKAFEVEADKALEQAPYDREILEEIKETTIELNKKNADVIGYLYLEDYLNDPIVYTPEEMEYYLHKNIDKEEAFSGTPFLSSYGSGDFRFNALIYGHYMMDGSKFGTLMSILDQEQFENVKELVVYDLNNDQFIVYQLTHTFGLTDGEEFIVLDKFDNLLQMQNYNYKWYEDSLLKIDRPYESFSSHHLYLQTCEEAYGRERQVFTFQEVDRGR